MIIYNGDEDVADDDDDDEDVDDDDDGNDDDDDNDDDREEEEKRSRVLCLYFDDSSAWRCQKGLGKKLVLLENGEEMFCMAAPQATAVKIPLRRSRFSNFQMIQKSVDTNTPLMRKNRGRYPCPTMPPSIFPNVPPSCVLSHMACTPRPTKKTLTSARNIDVYEMEAFKEQDLLKVTLTTCYVVKNS
ncbi:hypothetical protein PoB_002916200 [Plakobranchus ocellatus]|uniref:Uncharacterized protein n=1 Tax=Plakobranchus ocellatus TaxID=259542 RepID=A0AAV4A6Z8_9GAST|nr:hypothetical protein PoB_002916200 [Plakobranchus ocellatus]